MNYFIWNVDPVLFSAGPLTIRWYGLCFAAAFCAGFVVMDGVFRREGKNRGDLDPLMLHMAVGTVLGARIGHCLFYDPVYYLSDPLRILRIWEGGLASHGGALGILLALYLYARKRPDQGYLWLLDRISLPAALGGCFIRVGNLFNSEILGVPGHVPWAVVFSRVDGLPRHPVQLYESLSYLLIFIFLSGKYLHMKVVPPGYIAARFLIGVFSARFFLEFFKETIAVYGAGLPLGVGQILSVPMVIAGTVLLFRVNGSRRG